MAPSVKENDTTVAPSAPATPGTPTGKPAGDPARTQPVALEIPVTVNGARTLEGTDKREPFSESTQTVLVFGNGAVIRLASALASGQLVFLTNEKTKKEVVCQVVKSKNYRTVTGYVELEFTEPAPGFWGMRFPAATPVATSPASVAPAPRPAAPTNLAPSASAIPASPKVTPPSPAAPPAPVAAKPVSPAPPPVAPPTVPAVVPPPPAALAISEPPKAPAPVATASPVLPPAPIPIPPAPVQVAPPVVPPVATISAPPVVEQRLPSKPSSLPLPGKDYTKEIAAIFSVPQAPVASPAPPTPTAAPANATASQPSTEELKLQAARLQEQLSAMLFTETPAKPAAPAPPAAITPILDVPKPDVAKKVLEFAQADLAPAPPLPPPAPIKVVPPPVKPIPSSLDAEEVQIPAWLAPLARNAEPAVSGSSTKMESAAVVEASSNSSAISSTSDDTLSEDSTLREQPTMFGGQLLTDSSEASVETSSSGSKKGLFLGLAAAALVVVGGAAWYARQPGNMLTGSSAAKPAVTQHSGVEPIPEASSKPEPVSSSPVAKPAPAPVTPAASQPSNVAPPVTNAPAPAPTPASNVSKNSTASARPVPPVEQPKKPSLGDVRLATPTVNRANGSQETSEAEPGVVGSQVETNGDLLAGLAGGHGKEPAAPLPVGGDVKPAQLIKSVAPIYPQVARSQRISGNVQIDALIDEHGNVTTAKILSGPPLLHHAAVDAVKQWKYTPAQLDGNPTSMHLTITVQFKTQ